MLHDETPVAFRSQGATLRGWLLTPAGAGPPLPAVIMTHGTSATIPMVAIEYARVFARSGLAVLIYDHRNFGGSDGEPRHEINPWIQCRGYLDALDFMCAHEAVDPDRIALWGDSYSGGQAASAGTTSPTATSACSTNPARASTRPRRSRRSSSWST